MTNFIPIRSSEYLQNLLFTLMLLTLIPAGVSAQQEAAPAASPSDSAEQEAGTELSPQERAQQALEKGDVALALAIYQRRAYAGEAWAQIILGQINQKGRLVEPSIANAVDWYGRAAANGSPEAQYRLGLIFCDEQNKNRLRPAKCVDWLQRAAAKKHPRALYQLASFAHQGRYIGGDLASTLELAKQARDAGVEEAKSLVTQINDDLRTFSKKVRVLDADIIAARYKPTKVTVRLAAFKKKSQLQRIALLSPLNKLYAYQRGNAWVLSHGSFSSPEKAQDAIAELDQDMYNLEPTALQWSEVLNNLQSSDN